MYFVEANALNRTGLAVGKDHGLADKLSLGLLELAEDRACSFLHGWHMVFHKSGGSFGVGLSLKAVEVVTSMRQRYVDRTASHWIWKFLAALNEMTAGGTISGGSLATALIEIMACG